MQHNIVMGKLSGLKKVIFDRPSYNNQLDNTFQHWRSAEYVCLENLYV